MKFSITFALGLLLSAAASAAAFAPSSSSSSRRDVRSSVSPSSSSSALSAATGLGSGPNKGAPAPLGNDNKDKNKGIFFDWFGSAVEKSPFGNDKSEVVVIETDFKLAWVFAFSAIFIWMAYPDRSVCDPSSVHFCLPSFVPGLCAFAHMWFAAFLADRSSRCRVVFDDGAERFSIRDLYKEGSWSYADKFESARERPKNYVVGGSSGWEYDSFVNYDFFPSVDLPVLVYFKEDKTPRRKWTVGPGKYDARDNGMVHFFPAFCDSYQLKREFEKRGLDERKPKE